MPSDTCVPVFPPPHPSTPRRKVLRNRNSSSENDSTSGDDHDNYISRLAQRYHKLAALPFELEPSSRPTSPELSARALQLHGKITHAMEDTNYNTSHPKWAHVSRLVRMAATSRRAGAAPGVRVGEKVKVDVGDYVFVLPDTEAEWEECEKKWAGRKFTHVPTANGNGKGKGKGKEREGIQAHSKYWSNNDTKKLAEVGSVGDLVEHDRMESRETKEARVTRRVRTWQAGVVHAERPLTLGETPAEVTVVDAKASKGKQGPSQTKQKQLSLEFTVVKHTDQLTTTKGGQGSSNAKPLITNGGGSPLDVRMDTPEGPKTPAPRPARALPDIMQVSSPLHIGDVSEAVCSVTLSLHALHV